MDWGGSRRGFKGPRPGPQVQEELAEVIRRTVGDTWYTLPGPLRCHRAPHLLWHRGGTAGDRQTRRQGPMETSRGVIALCSERNASDVGGSDSTCFQRPWQELLFELGAQRTPCVTELHLLGHVQASAWPSTGLVPQRRVRERDPATWARKSARIAPMGENEVPCCCEAMRNAPLAFFFTWDTMLQAKDGFLVSCVGAIALDR